MQTYTVLDFFSNNPILFVGLIVFAVFWIALAIFYTINYIKYKQTQKTKKLNFKPIEILSQFSKWNLIYSRLAFKIFFYTKKIW